MQCKCGNVMRKTAKYFNQERYACSRCGRVAKVIKTANEDVVSWVDSLANYNELVDTLGLVCNSLESLHGKVDDIYAEVVKQPKNMFSQPINKKFDRVEE